MSILIAAASGNTFAYIWAQDLPSDCNRASLSVAICTPKHALKLDGLFILDDFTPGVPWVMEHYEPDGQRTFCSNGTRAACVMLPEGWTGEIQAQVSGEWVALRVEKEQVALKMPEGPGYGFQEIPKLLDAPHVLGFTGTPHLIIELPDVRAVDLRSFAPPLRHHPALSEGANVSLVEVTGDGMARIRTWERGVEGETLCCGQGCAVAGAWLARRGNTKKWRFQPMGEDPVWVEVESVHDTQWKGLWLSGPIRRLPNQG